MTDDAHIHIVVSENQKENWQQYAEGEHGTLSHLIRSAVQAEIDSDGASSDGSIPDDLTETLNDIRGQHESVERELQGVKRELRELKDAVGTTDAEVTELANRVLDVLPETRGEPSEAEIDALTDHEIGESDTPPTTVEGLADALGEPADLVGDALAMLEKDTHLVRSDDHGGTVHYQRVGR